LFGWDANNLSPDQTLRVDCATPIRLALDAEQGKVLRGEATDPSKMVSLSEAFARIMPPTVLAAPPAEHRSDPRERLLEMYFTMRERGGVSQYGTEFDAMRETAIALADENELLRAEVAALKAGTALPMPLPPNVATIHRPAAGAEAAQPRRPAAAPAAPTEPSGYDYNRESGWRDYVEPSGHIRSTPRGGKDWGPV
jgi:hypothetical protein